MPPPLPPRRSDLPPFIDLSPHGAGPMSPPRDRAFSDRGLAAFGCAAVAVYTAIALGFVLLAFLAFGALWVLPWTLSSDASAPPPPAQARMDVMTSDRPDALARAASLIAEIPDYPEPGVLFRDVSPVLADAEALRAVTAAMLAPFEGEFDVVAGIEARGFLLAGAAAILCGVGLVPIRKAGKLPRPAAKVEYDLEYGHAAVEVNADVPAGTRVLLVDDVLATGGTFCAAADVLREIGAEPVGATALMELPELEGRRRLGELRFATVF